MDFRLSEHTKDVMKERNILKEWVWRTLDKPDWENVGSDKNMHYFKSITEHRGRILQ